MFSISPQSISFEPPLPYAKKLWITIQTPEGDPHKTEPFTARRDKVTKLNKVSISEAETLYLKKNAYFLIEIHEPGDDPKTQSKPIGKETVVLKDLQKDSNYDIVMPTIYGTDAIINLSFNLLNELMDPDNYVNTTKPESTSPKKKQKKQMKTKEFGVSFLDTKQLPSLNELVLSISPLVILSQNIYDFFTWKDPNKTFLLSFCFTLLTMLGRYSVGLALLIFGFFGDYLLKSMSSTSLTENSTQNEQALYKKNQHFLQGVINYLLQVLGFYRSLFANRDKTSLAQIFKQLKKPAITASFIFFMCHTETILVFTFWAILLYNTYYGRYYIQQSFGCLSNLLTHKKSQEHDTASLEDLDKEIDQKVFENKESVKHHHYDEEPLPKSLDSLISTDIGTLEDLKASPEKAENNIWETQIHRLMKEETFVVYENQRWYPGKGWSSQLIPGERPSWSDDLGKIELEKEDFRLPGEHWNWVSDWTVVIDLDTDLEGWKYASNFSKFSKVDFDEDSVKVKAVRRRKWIRCCICLNSSMLK